MQLTVNGCHSIVMKLTSFRDKQWLQVPFHAGLSGQLSPWSRRVHLSKGGFEERNINCSGNGAMPKLHCREDTLPNHPGLLGWRGMLSNREGFKEANGCGQVFPHMGLGSLFTL